MLTQSELEEERKLKEQDDRRAADDFGYPS
jgi:hypothetical protein